MMEHDKTVASTTATNGTDHTVGVITDTDTTTDCKPTPEEQRQPAKNRSDNNDHDAESSRTNHSPDVSSALALELRSVFVEKFSKLYSDDVVEPSLQQLKDYICFDLNSQYTGELVNSMFAILKENLNKKASLLMNDLFEQNIVQIQKLASIASQKPANTKHNHLNGDLIQEVKPEPTDNNHVFSFCNGDVNIGSAKNQKNESLESQSLNKVDTQENQEEMDIDVDALLNDDDLESRKSENDDSSQKAESENDENDETIDHSKQIPNDCEKVRDGALETFINNIKAQINIPDIEKDLKRIDSEPVSDNSSTEQVSSIRENKKVTIKEDQTKEEKELISLDISSISNDNVNINDDDNNHKDDKEKDDEFLHNPFDNFQGIDDLEQLCNVAVTGDMSEEESDNLVDKNEKVKEKYDVTEKTEIAQQKPEENNDNLDDDSNSYSVEDNLMEDEPHSDDVKNPNEEGNEKETNKIMSHINSLISNAEKLVDKSSSDVDNDKKTIEKTDSMNDNSDAQNEEEISNTPRKKTKKRLLSDDESNKEEKQSMSSDTESEESDTSSSKKKKKKQNAKKKRKRIVLGKSSDDESNSEKNESDSDSHNTSRKKVRKIISPTRLNKETVNAEKAERERRKRIEEKQRLYNQLAEQSESKPSSQVDEVVLDIDKETKKVLVEINHNFIKYLKPHQVEGIKFLFNCTIETVKRFNEDMDGGGGGILAHSMGLGKTFQVIVFLHTIMTNEHLKNKIKRVLIIVPYNVIKNWAQEFEKWFEECGIEKDILIYEISGAKPSERSPMLNMWHSNGGIMLMTINLFSSLCKGKSNNKKAKTNLTIAKKCLLDPGADLVIIDEGHLLKNDQGAFNRCVSQVKTLRRLILTGTPLQNNLSEYFTMVDFVKPRLLGTKKEFKNRFENPINNGQHTDSTEFDVKLMKKRIHVLHTLLENCIHRRDYNVLLPYLQPKMEYVLSLRMTETQIKLYKYYIDNLVDRSRGGFPNLFHDNTILGYIWNHPALLHEYYTNKKDEEEEEEDNSMDEFIDDSTSENSDSDDDVPNKKKRVTRSRIVLDNKSSEDDSDIEIISETIVPKKEEKLNEDDLETQRLLREKVTEEKKFATNDWYEQHLPEDIYKMDLSVKFTILFSILEKCEVIGDKILIFSQSLSTLNLIEHFLKEKMDEYLEKYGKDKSYDELVAETGGVSHRWIRNIDYFRIDGNVSSQIRTSVVNKINDPDEHRARLMLISTKAGGIGINLVGANRCIIFDASWNPSNDLQAIFRILRYGQTKPVYIYRFTAFGTMESKKYERQIIKQSLSCRVVDEKQIQRQFKASEISELYTFNPGTNETPVLPAVPADTLLADILIEQKDLIMSCHKHDSLLEAKDEKPLSDEELKAAWMEYETEKERPFLQPPNPMVNQAQNQATNAAFYEAMRLMQLRLQHYRFTQQFNNQFNQNSVLNGLLQQQSSSGMNLQQNRFVAPNILNRKLPVNPSTTLLQHNDANANINFQRQSTNHNNVMESTINQNQQYTQKFLEFLKNCGDENIVNIYKDFSANINLHTIMSFAQKNNLKDLETDLAMILKAKSFIYKTDDYKTEPARTLMYNYLEKCIAIANAYDSQMTHIKMPFPGVVTHPMGLEVKKGHEKLRKLHLEFVRQYKGSNIAPNLPPNFRNNSQPMVSRTLRSSRPSSSNQHSDQFISNIECITLSDDEM